MTTQSELNTVPTLLQKKITALSDEQQADFFKEYKKRHKSFGIASLLWLFGIHYLYFTRIGLFFLFIFTGGGLIIWWFIDAFRLKGMIQKSNEEATIAILKYIS